MKLEEAIILLKNGKKVRPISWYDSDFLFLVLDPRNSINAIFQYDAETQECSIFHGIGHMLFEEFVIVNTTKQEY